MADDTKFRWSTRVFLVLLRLAIGWHFFFEGWDKLLSYSTPESPGWDRLSFSYAPPAPGRKKRWWSSEEYLQQARGPLAGLFRWMSGDPILDRVEGDPEGDLPPAVLRDWDSYFDYFTEYYDLNDKQLQDARNRLAQRKDQLRSWLYKEVMDGRTTQQRVQDYHKALEKLDKIETGQVKNFGPDAEKTEVAKHRGEAGKLRKQLFTGLLDQYEEMKSALLVVPTPAERREKDRVEDGERVYPRLKEPLPPSLWHWRWNWLSVEERKKPTLNEQEPFTPPVGSWSRLDWINFITRYALTIIGLCLLLGLFTRTACVAGSLFLLMFFLAMPPLPGLPESPRAEGHYFLINKNIIEILALWVLATTRSGRWAGLDALLQFLNPWRWRKAAPSPVPVSTPSVEVVRTEEKVLVTPSPREESHSTPPPVHVSESPVKKEPPHGH